MNFSLPELPEEQRSGTGAPAKPDASEGDKTSGSYDALMAKLGRKSLPENPVSPKKAKNVLVTLLSTDETATDEGFEVDIQEAAEATAVVPPHFSGPLTAICKWLSWILMPMFMPIVSIILMLFLTPLRNISASDKLITILIVAGFNTLLPMVLIVALKLLGVVHDIGLNSRRERLIPYIIIIIGLVCTSYFLHLQGGAVWMWGTFAGAAVGSVMCCIINFLWKISAHAMGVAGVIGTLVVLGVTGQAVVNLQWWLFCSCILAGLLGSARVFLRRHTDLQVLAGLICGFCCVFFTTIYLMK